MTKLDQIAAILARAKTLRRGRDAISDQLSSDLEELAGLLRAMNHDQLTAADIEILRAVIFAGADFGDAMERITRNLAERAGALKMDGDNMEPGPH